MAITRKREAWNKGKRVGQKPPLKPKDIRVTVARTEFEMVKWLLLCLRRTQCGARRPTSADFYA
jgi:hypothetical protein